MSFTCALQCEKRRERHLKDLLEQYKQSEEEAKKERVGVVIIIVLVVFTASVVFS